MDVVDLDLYIYHVKLQPRRQISLYIVDRDNSSMSTMSVVAGLRPLHRSATRARLMASKCCTSGWSDPAMGFCPEQRRLANLFLGCILLMLLSHEAADAAAAAAGGRVGITGSSNNKLHRRIDVQVQTSDNKHMSSFLHHLEAAEKTRIHSHDHSLQPSKVGLTPVSQTLFKSWTKWCGPGQYAPRFKKESGKGTFWHISPLSMSTDHAMQWW